MISCGKNVGKQRQMKIIAEAFTMQRSSRRVGTAHRNGRVMVGNAHPTHGLEGFSSEPQSRIEGHSIATILFADSLRNSLTY